MQNIIKKLEKEIKKAEIIEIASRFKLIDLESQPDAFVDENWEIEHKARTIHNSIDRGELEGLKRALELILESNNESLRV